MDSTDKDKNDNFNFEKLKIIKNYFSRIFNVLPKDIREDLLKLNLSKEELKSILKKIAFLTEEKQRMFLEEISNNLKNEEEF